MSFLYTFYIHRVQKVEQACRVEAGPLNQSIIVLFPEILLQEQEFTEKVCADTIIQEIFPLSLSKMIFENYLK